MHTLTSEQLRLTQAINNMQAGDRLLASGRAGSGKTFAIAHSLAGRKPLFLTPTHSARRVLQHALPDRSAKVMTIHSAVGWRRGLDKDLNWYDCYRSASKAKSQTPFADADIIVVDECSMVGAKLFKKIEEYANEYKLPVVYSGDPFQLPPVMDREVITKQGFDTITLTHSMRFPKDSEIYRIGEMLRDWIEHRPDEELPILFGGAAVEVVRGDDWMTGLSQGYQNSKDLLAVTSDNETLLRLRSKVRQVDHNRLVSGDLVISKKTDEQIKNGEKFTISRIELTRRTLEDVPRCVSASRTLSLLGEEVTFLETSRKAFILKDREKAADLMELVKYHHHRRNLGHRDATRIIEWLEHGNSFELAALSTVHKSQGRTVDVVYVDTNTVLKRPFWQSKKDHKRSLYTAITRARERVVFYEMAGFCQVGAANSPLEPSQNLSSAA